MMISLNGIELLQYFEKCRLDAYLDSGGKPTIGYGETHNVHLGDTWTQQQADDMLKARLIEFSTGVSNMLVARHVQQQEFDALVCFAYNTGLAALRDSTLLKRLLAGVNYFEEFWSWIYVDHQVNKGLISRRTAEMLLAKGKNWRDIV